MNLARMNIYATKKTANLGGKRPLILVIGHRYFVSGSDKQFILVGWDRSHPVLRHEKDESETYYRVHQGAILRTLDGTLLP